MVTPQMALRVQKANSQIPRGLDAVQDTRHVYVLSSSSQSHILNRDIVLATNEIPIPDRMSQNGLYRNMKRRNRRYKNVLFDHFKVNISLAEDLSKLWKDDDPKDVLRINFRHLNYIFKKLITFILLLV